MADDANTEDPDAAPPSDQGGLVPRAADAFGLRIKLETYSLDVTHPSGGPKARGFERILGITIDAIEYLEAQILARLLDTPVTKIRDNPPHGVNYVVDIQVRGIGAKADRVITVRIISAPGDAPRLVTALPKP
jgi:uncharacterized protein